MTIDSLKAQVKKQVEKYDLKAAFELVKSHVKTDEHSGAFSLLRKRYTKLIREQIVGLRTPQEVDTQENQIAQALIQYVETLEQEDLKEPRYVVQHQLITNKILVYTTGDKDKLSTFFKMLNFKNAVVKTYQEWSAADWTDFELVVFDNQDLPFNKDRTPLSEAQRQATQERITLMEEVIRASSLFVVHYGEFLGWINNHRNRIQSANSQFSLFARIREMLEFINTYSV